MTSSGEGCRRVGRAYRHWQEQTQDMLAEQQRWIEQHISRSQHQGLDYGLDL